MRISAKGCVYAVGVGMFVVATMGAGAGPAAPNQAFWRLPDPRPDAAVWRGEVRIHTDGEGRLAVIVDEQRGRSLPDGTADHLFLFQAATPILEAIDERMGSAQVTLTGGTLRVASRRSGLIVDLALAGGPESRHDVTRGWIVLHDGIALQSRDLLDPAASLDSVRTESFVLVETPGQDGSLSSPRPWCDSGGDGSQSCSFNCSMSSASISRADGCTISCAPGFYACCGCNWLYKAHCACIREPVKGEDWDFGIDR